MPQPSTNPTAPPRGEESPSDRKRPLRETALHYLTRPWVLLAILLISTAVIYHDQLESSIRRIVAKHYADMASKKLAEESSTAARLQVEKALQWLPDDPALVYLRAQIHAEEKQWEAALRDYDYLLGELAPNLAPAYVGRAMVYTRQAGFDKALNDINRAIELSPQDSPTMLNHHAYISALAGKDLEDALENVERAIEIHQVKRSQELTPSPLDIVYAFIDTRGYVLYRLGRHDEALVEFNRALELLKNQHAMLIAKLEEQDLSTGVASRDLNRIEGEVVYHRALVHEAKGNADEAKEDFQLAEDLGFEPPKQTHGT